MKLRKRETRTLIEGAPDTKAGPWLGPLGFDVVVDNIGNSPAKNIQGSCKIIPQTDITLEKNGMLTVPLLARNERATYDAIVTIPSDRLSSQNLVIEATYSDSKDKKQKPVREETSIGVLRKNFETWILTKNRHKVSFS